MKMVDHRHSGLDPESKTDCSNAVVQLSGPLSDGFWIPAFAGMTD